jgi:hypothetical protein
LEADPDGSLLYAIDLVCAVTHIETAVPLNNEQRSTRSVIGGTKACG